MAEIQDIIAGPLACTVWSFLIVFCWHWRPSWLTKRSLNVTQCYYFALQYYYASTADNMEFLVAILRGAGVYRVIMAVFTADMFFTFVANLSTSSYF
eukprot:5809064-Amphidinium_carterae.1